MNNTILIFSPHPDDETLGCGGTIIKKRGQGYKIIIIILTDGRHAFTKTYNIYSNPTPEELIRIRKKEVEKSVMTLGIPLSNLIYLDYEDSTLDKNYGKVKDTISKYIKKHNPSEIYTTYKHDAHRDHRVTYQAVYDSYNLLGIDAKLYQYSIARNFSFFRPFQDHVSNLILNNIEYVDISKYLHIKKKALEEMKSQLTIYAKKQKYPALNSNIVKNHLKNYEKFFIK